MVIHWNIKSFGQLSLEELYQILRLRNEVFIVEQQCPYVDIDNSDQQAMHLQGYTADGRLAAYARLFPAGIKFEMVSIGRVATALFARGTGAGRQLMEEAIAACENLYGKVPLKIGAQLYLKEFYMSLGFVQTSEIYLEDGIEHIEMIRS